MKNAGVVDGHIDYSWPKSRGVKKPSFLKAIIKTFGKKYALIGILAFIEECVLRYGEKGLHYLRHYRNGDIHVLF